MIKLLDQDYHLNQTLHQDQRHLTNHRLVKQDLELQKRISIRKRKRKGVRKGVRIKGVRKGVKKNLFKYKVLIILKWR